MDLRWSVHLWTRKMNLLHASLIFFKTNFLPLHYSSHFLLIFSVFLFFSCFLSSQVSEDIRPAKGDHQYKLPCWTLWLPKDAPPHPRFSPGQQRVPPPSFTSGISDAGKDHFQRINDPIFLYERIPGETFGRQF